MASLIDFRGKGLKIQKIPLGTIPIILSGLPRELEGPGKIYVMTALIEYLTVLLEYIDFLGALKKSGGQGKMPQLPPPPPPLTLSGPEYSQLAIIVLITLLLYGETLHSW